MSKDFKNYNDFDIVSFDYFYDMDDNYYKSISRLKLTKITKQEYINATGDSSFIIQKLTSKEIKKAIRYVIENYESMSKSAAANQQISFQQPCELSRVILEDS